MRDVTVFAPGRVNLIGEHTDYSGGLVLPVAIDLGVTVRGRRSRSAIRLRSDAFGETVELGCDGSPERTVEGWGRYVAAVALLLDRHGRPRVGFEGVIESTVPPGAGLSSSAALDVAVGVALCRSAGFELPPIELARLAREAELLAVGVPCGLMDPATALLGRRGHALLLDCGTEEYRHVPLPPDIAIVVLDSGVRHALEHSGYATRRAELERGAGGDRRPPPDRGDARGGRRSRTSSRRGRRRRCADYATSSPRTSASAAASPRSTGPAVPTSTPSARSSGRATRASGTTSRSRSRSSTCSSSSPTGTEPSPPA